MGKITLEGPVPKDDPMFLTGPELISRPGSNESSTTSAIGMTAATQANSDSANAPETEADGKDLGARRIAKFKHQNEQMRKHSKG
jgi:hypothetical protein